MQILNPTRSKPIPFQIHGERRRKPRIVANLTARVRGVDAQGRSFDVMAQLDNLSVGGLYLRIGFPVDVTTPLLVIFRLNAGAEVDDSGMVWAARCVARREERHPDGSCGLGVGILRYRQI